MFSRPKYYAALAAGTVLAIVTAAVLPNEADAPLIILTISGSTFLVLRSTYWSGKNSKVRYERLLSAARTTQTMAQEHREKHSEALRRLDASVHKLHSSIQENMDLKFGQNEARVRQIDASVHKLHSSIQENMDLKFGQNEVRVRQIGSIARRTEDVIRSLNEAHGNATLDGSFKVDVEDDVRQRAAAEVKYRIMDDLSTLLLLVQELKSDTAQSHYDGTGV